MDTASCHGNAPALKATLPKLVMLQSRERLQQISGALESRYTRRLSDRIKASFYEACRIGNLHAARQLAEALNYEATRSLYLIGADLRENDDGLAAVWARYEAEVVQQQQDQG